METQRKEENRTFWESIQDEINTIEYSQSRTFSYLKEDFIVIKLRIF